MNTAVESKRPESNASSTSPTAAPADLMSMDRDALARLVESLFRWALKYTGLTRQQIMAQITRDGGTPP